MQRELLAVKVIITGRPHMHMDEQALTLWMEVFTVSIFLDSIALVINC